MGWFNSAAVNEFLSHFFKQRPSYCCDSRVEVIVLEFSFNNDNIRVKTLVITKTSMRFRFVLLIRECRKSYFSSCVEKLKPSSEQRWPQIKLSVHKHGRIFYRIERGDLHLRFSQDKENFLAQSIAVIDPPLLRSYEWMSCAAHAPSSRKFINKPCVQCGSRDHASQKRATNKTRYLTRRNLLY